MILVYAVFLLDLIWSLLRPSYADSQRSSQFWIHQNYLLYLGGDPYGQVVENRSVGLPPKTVALAMVLFLVVPLIADVHNQFLTASSSKRILNEIILDENSPKTGFSAVTNISIRIGPTQGDDVIGILPKGAHIQVLEERSGWVEIGENKWIQQKYIKPHSANNEKETIGSKTNSLSPDPA